MCLHGPGSFYLKAREAHNHAPPRPRALLRRLDHISGPGPRDGETEVPQLGSPQSEGPLEAE